MGGGGAAFLFRVCVVLVSQVNIAALGSLATPQFCCSFSAAASLCSAPRLCSDLTVTSREVSERQGVAVGLRLGSSAGVVGDGAGDQCRRTGMEPACLAVASQPRSVGADPARAAVKPVAVSDPC